MPKPICEDAPCCGCCGQSDYSDSDWDDVLVYERLREETFEDDSFDQMNPVYDPIEDGQDEDDCGHHCDEMGDEDRYLDSYWEDRFGDCDY